MFKHLLRFVLLVALAVPLGTRAQSILLNEGFEDWPPEGWSTIHVSGTVEWESYSGGHGGSASASVNYAYAGHNNYLVTPQLTPETGDSLVFWVSSQNYSGTTLTIEVSTGTPNESAFTTTLATYTSGSAGTIGTTNLTNFVEKKLDLSAYVGQNIFIAFHIAHISQKHRKIAYSSKVKNLNGISKPAVSAKFFTV